MSVEHWTLQQLTGLPCLDSANESQLSIKLHNKSPPTGGATAFLCSAAVCKVCK